MPKYEKRCPKYEKTKLSKWISCAQKLFAAGNSFLALHEYAIL